MDHSSQTLHNLRKQFEVFGDINSYINSANNVRRELTKGQKAMAYAFMFPEAERLKRKFPEETTAPNKVLLAKARTVLSHSETLASEVMAKVVGLNEAYETAMAKKRQSQEQKDKLNMLQNKAADLYDRVTAKELSLDEAVLIFHDKEGVRIQNMRNHIDKYQDFLSTSYSIVSESGIDDLVVAINEADEVNIIGIREGVKEQIKILERTVKNIPYLLEKLK